MHSINEKKTLFFKKTNVTCSGFSDALSSSLSAFYAKIVIIAGIAVPVTEVLTSRIPLLVYQSFYVYLYTVSIFFVIFVYTAHMRTRAVFSLIKNYRKNHSISNISKIQNSKKMQKQILFGRRKNKQ